MKLKLQGNIEKANYFLIYKGLRANPIYNVFKDHPIFLFSNGESSNIFNMEENCNYWFNINEINKSNNFNFNSQDLDVWTVECFIDCPELKNIDSLNSNKFDYRSLISYLKSSSIINDNYNIEAIDLFNLKEIIIKTKLAIKEERRNNRINSDKFSILEHIIELLSNNVDLNLLNKMEHRKDESNAKPKLGEEYYEILTDIDDLKYIINNFKNLMNNIKPKDLLKLRSISELKYYIKNKTVVNGEMKLKEEEFIAKVKEILSNE